MTIKRDVRRNDIKLTETILLHEPKEAGRHQLRFRDELVFVMMSLYKVKTRKAKEREGPIAHLNQGRERQTNSVLYVPSFLFLKYFGFNFKQNKLLLGYKVVLRQVNVDYTPNISGM